MKNILLCIPTLASAGAERFVTELACSINKQKYNVIVIITKIYDKETAFWKKLNQENIEIVNATESNYIKQIFTLCKIIRKYKPSIVHTNVSSALYMILPLSIAGTKTKHIFTVHSMGYRIFSGIKKKIMRACFNSGRIVPVAICDTVKQSLVDAYSLPEEKVECVYNGVDTKRFQKKSDNQSELFTFVNVGTLYHIKNHELLINAFKNVSDIHENVKLIIVGDGELRNQLENQVKNLGIQNKVEFVGNQPNVITYLSKADVYCCTSKVEGLPISVLEAMSCRLPIITTPAGGVIDIVEDNINGFIVEMDSLKLANKMNELIENKILLEKMSLKSRELALKYDIKNCAIGYEKLYEKIGE